MLEFNNLFKERLRPNRLGSLEKLRLRRNKDGIRLVALRELEVLIKYETNY